MKKFILLLGLVVVVLLIGWFSPYRPLFTEPVATNDKPLITVQYACDAGKTLTASYFAGSSTLAVGDQPPVSGGHVELNLSDGRNLTLAQTISADGARYATTDEAFVFWSKGNGALVLENNTEKSYIGCVAVSPNAASDNLSQIYANSSLGVTLRFPSLVASSSAGYPDSFKVDESYIYQASPTLKIAGVKFTIPETMATGTNLSADSYLSLESLPASASCSASLFLDGNHPTVIETLAGQNYSVASSSNAGAGNRYEETVYAFPDTNPCLAVRYLVHYSVFENYPAGTITKFDQPALLKLFDQIRATLVYSQ